MERPTKRLWRKIGLQKNFLQGTSHSDQSKNTLSRLQQSLNKSQYSNPNEVQETEALIFEAFKVKNEGKSPSDMLKELVNLKRQANYEQGSCESPINKLNMSSNYDNNMIWQVADDTIELINEQKKTESNFTEQIKQSMMYFESIRVKQEKQEQRKNVTQTVPYIVNKQRELGNVRFSVNRDYNHASIQENGRKTSIDSMKIRLHGVQQKQSQTNESQYARNLIKSYNKMLQTSIQHIYTLQIEPKQLEKYQQLQEQFNKFKSSATIPKLHEQVVQLKKSLAFQKSFIIQKVNLMKDTMIQFIKNDLSQQIQQLNDQIGYLYSQNAQLMTKLQEKQSFIKKHHQQYGKLQQKLAEYTQSITAEHEQKENKIIQLQNQVNQLEEKLQDFSDLQTKIQLQQSKLKQLQSKNQQLQSKNQQFQSVNQHLQYKNQQLQCINQQLQCKNQQLQCINQQLQCKNQQLQAQINIFMGNQRKTHELMDQKTFDLSAAIIKNQQLQWEINELYSKNEQLEYNFRNQLALNSQKLQNQHFNRLNIQKSFLQKQKLKNKDQQIMVSTLSRLLNESLKHISLNLIEAIHKQFNTQMNQQIHQIFSQAINQAQSSSRAYNYNKDNRPFANENQNQHSPRQSENGNSSSKNLRRTGYFGQVTKPTLTIRLDDIQKNFSTQIPQDQVNADNSFEQRPKSVSQQKKTLFRGDTFSQISQQGSVKEDYAFKTLQSSYPRNQQRRWSKQRHNRHQSDGIGRVELNESITEDLKRVKLSLKQEVNQRNSRQYQNQVETYDRPNNQQFPNNQNINYSFSEMNNWNAFDSNDDRSSVTTYEKSENNYNRDQEKYTSKHAHSYHRPSTDRSEKSQKSNSQRHDIIQKIKERVRLKLKSKEKYKQEITRNEPTYGYNGESSVKRHSYNQAEYDQAPAPIKKEDMILADFYQRHSIKNPVVTQHQTQRKMSPISASRSPSNPRSRSPSSSSASRVTNTHGTRTGITKYTPLTTTATYGVGSHSRTSTNTVSRSAFSQSMVERPQFTAYSKRLNQPNTTTTATYQNNNTSGTYQATTSGTYQPKSGLYSINRGENQAGSSYVKKY